MTLKNIIFDAYGTLVTTPANKAYLTAFARLGLDKSVYVPKCLTERLDWVELGISKAQYAQFHADLAREASTVALLPWAKEFLNTTKRVCVLSNLAEGYEAPLRDLIGPHQVFCSYRIGLRKPDPKAFLYVVSAMGFKIEETLVVDDKPANILAAERLGFATELILPHDTDKIKHISNLIQT